MSRPVRRAAALIAILLATSCGRDVVVGVNFTDPDASALERDGGTPNAGDGGERSGLLAVARLGSGTHVGAGFVGCDQPADGACDGWLVAAGSDVARVTEEGRFAAPGLDVVWSLARDADDTRLIAGERTAAGVGFAWVARRSATGTLAWETSIAAAPTLYSTARAVAVAADGTVIVGGDETLANGQGDGWVARISPAGGLLSRYRIGSNSPHLGSSVSAVTVIPQSQIHAGGASLVNGISVATAYQFSPVGDLWNSQEGLGFPLQPGRVKSVLGDRSLEVTHCAEIGDSAVVARRESGLAPILSRQFTEPGAVIALGGCVVTDDGAIVLAGTITRANVAHPWAAKVERVTLEVRWTRTFDAEEGSLAAVAPTAGGASLAVGTSRGQRYVLPIAP